MMNPKLQVQENWEEILSKLKDPEKAEMPQIVGLEEWLEEMDLEEYLEDVLLGD